MLELTTSSRFRRELKKVLRDGRDKAKLASITDALIAGRPLPQAICDHALSGEWRGYRDCHIEPDWVLIYRKSKTAIHLERTGSHSDLFR